MPRRESARQGKARERPGKTGGARRGNAKPCEAWRSVARRRYERHGKGQFKARHGKGQGKVRVMAREELR